MSFIPDVLQIVGNRILVRPYYEEFTEKKDKTLRQLQNEKNLRSNFPAGLVTRKIRQRMVKILDVWIKSLHYSAYNEHGYKEYKPTFVTLTLPSEQKHSDKELHQLALNRFIIGLQRRYHVKYYLWRAERQANSNLHYHVIIDRFIGHAEVKAQWNMIMNDLGYIDRYRVTQKQFHKDGFKVREELLHKWNYTTNQVEDHWTIEQQAKAYNEGVRTNWSSPNSTDIHGLKNIEDVTSYISKYITKCEEYKEYQQLKKAHNDGMLSDEAYAECEKQMLAVLEAKKINGRCWGCSDELRSITEPKLIVDNVLLSFIDTLENDKAVRIIQGDGYKIYYSDTLKKQLQKHPVLSRQLSLHYRGIYRALYAPIPELIFDKPPDPAPVKAKAIQAYQLHLDHQYF